MSMEWNPATMQDRLLNALRSSMRRINRSACLTGLLLVAGLSSGCTNLTQPLSGVPARRLPPQFLTQSKSNLVPLDPSRLKQEEPRQYLIDDGDILGIYIQGILPFTKADQPEEPPPVNFPEKESTLDPSIGYPILVQEDDTISLPSIEPLKVKGMTISQIRDLIRKAYIDAKIFPDVSKLQPSVTIMKERTYDIVVVRQDVGTQGQQQQMNPQFGTRGNLFRGSDQSSSGQIVKLPAYQNDVLHALMQSGGLPGLSARNEVKILKASRVKQQERDAFIQQFYATYYSNPNPCSCPPPLPDDPSVVKIPMRLPPGVIPSFSPEDILLEDGDVVYIESRDAEVFYTGGLLPGGEFLIPRDYDLDVLGAMAMAGAGVGSRVQGGGGFGIGSIGGVAPGQLFILRKTPCNGQITIEVDLARATQDPRERPLIQPGDTLILRHKPIEEVVNFSIGTFFTFGLQALIQAAN